MSTSQISHVTCPDCAGTGFSAWDQCTMCGGLGQVISETPDFWDAVAKAGDQPIPAVSESENEAFWTEVRNAQNQAL